ncbi:uncharacterized protein RJT20DRAFT_146996 [Scheffersomyces xylosifermentans]|uniref:uncharacterized protein n=1 Tax=Scheffersomyces xylosifermentans TaxID=1304137 RepID=UPI00315C8B58
MSQIQKPVKSNKRRPKKVRPPYKRYVYKSNFANGNSSDEEFEEEDQAMMAAKDPYGNYKDFDVKSNLNIRSVYVLTNQESSYTSKIWPRSQFEKIDVLRCCINNGNSEYLKKIEEAYQIQQYEESLMNFPVEVIVRIFEILLAQGKLKPKFLRVCKLFYSLALPMIYSRPILRAPNFFSFVDTLSNSKTIGNHIRELDLSYIIQTGKNAFVAKLLKRSRKNLEMFVAPQTSFGLGPLIALKNCEQLKVLDLSLVSETLNLEELFNSIRNLHKLTHLSFPRSSIEVNNFKSISWPPQLSYLRISGGISDDFLSELTFPPTITQMEFAHCPSISDLGLRAVMNKLGSKLTTLKVQYPMRGLKMNSLDSVFIYCPNLRVLEISVDYVSNTFFDEENLQYIDYPRPLRTLYINSSGSLGTTTKLDPIDLAVALNEGRLPMLKNIQCTAKLGWDPKSDAVNYIVDELDERQGGLYIGY